MLWFYTQTWGEVFGPLAVLIVAGAWIDHLWRARRARALRRRH